jgi:hypothetical protein
LTDNNNNTFANEITGRLGEFFSEDDRPASYKETNNASIPHEYSFAHLKAVVLSIEWEITDQVLDSMLSEISRLKEVYADDKILLAFLQLHGSVGQYIRSKKVTAHPDAIRLLHSIYQSLEKVVTTPDVSEKEKKRSLSDEVKRFKQLKEKVLFIKKGVSGEDTTRIEEFKPSEPEREKMPAPETNFTSLVSISHDLNEIKKIIKAEFAALKEELELWRQR